MTSFYEQFTTEVLKDWAERLYDHMVEGDDQAWFEYDLIVKVLNARDQDP